MFSDFTREQVERLENNLKVHEFDTGSTIITQGDKGEFFYLITEGEVNVFIQDETNLLRLGDYGRMVSKLKLGCYFGEKALLSSEPSKMSVVAVEKTTCIVFSRIEFESIISSSTALIDLGTKDAITL